MVEPNINGGAVASVGLISALLVVVTVQVLQVIYFRTENSELERKVLNAPYTEYKTEFAEQMSRLEGGKVTDKNLGYVSIPISKAMELTVADLLKSSKK